MFLKLSHERARFKANIRDARARRAQFSKSKQKQNNNKNHTQCGKSGYFTITIFAQKLEKFS